MYPPVPHVGREAEQDDVLPGSKTFVPKGVSVYCEFAVMHQDPKVWGPDATEFRPERWEEPGLDEKVTNKHWLPFSGGNRNCIGKDFAMNEMQLILTQLVRTFHFGWPQGQPEPEPYALITLRTKNPYDLRGDHARPLSSHDVRNCVVEREKKVSDDDDGDGSPKGCTIFI